MQVTVLVMGGRITPTDECLKVFFHLAGGDAARILILPTACHNVLAVQEYARGLEMLGVRYPPTILPVWEREQAEDRSLVRVLTCASAVLILGGDLNRLLAVVRGTQLHHALWQAGAAGVVIGGISAGAAALGTWVGGLEGALRPSRWQPALGVLPHTVIVPHFHRQGRLEALLRITSRYPGWLGLGVDEATGVIVCPSGLQGVGAGQVTLITVVERDSTPEGGPWIVRLCAGQSLAWSALPWLRQSQIRSWEMIRDEFSGRPLPPVAGSTDVMFHLFQK